MREWFEYHQKRVHQGALTGYDQLQQRWLGRVIWKNPMAVLAPWLRPFEFQNGRKTELLDQSALLIHESRAAGIFPMLDDLFSTADPVFPVSTPLVAKHCSACKSRSAVRGLSRD